MKYDYPDIVPDDLMWTEKDTEALKRLHRMVQTEQERKTNGGNDHSETVDFMEFPWSFCGDPSQEIAVCRDGWRADYVSVLHSHDYFEIVYVYSGHCITQASSQTVELSAGDICLYDLHAVHKIEFTGPTDRIFNIMIRKDVFRQLLLELLVESDELIPFYMRALYDQEKQDHGIYLRHDENYQCTQMARQIIETLYWEPPKKQLTLKSQMLLFLMEIARQYREEQIMESKREAAGLDIEAVITYISNHYIGTSKEDVARYFGYSTRSLTRLLKQYTGRGYQEIVQDVRFSYARMLLQKDLLSMDEVALAVGYRDRSNFENAFKKYCHITPSAYRRQFGAK